MRTDALIAAYLAGTAVLLAGLNAPWPWLAVHGVGLLGVALGALGRLPAWLHLHYPLPLCFLLYLELDCYAPLTGRVFDETVLGWEQALFGTSPAMWLSQVLPSRGLSELLHLGYLSYYLMVPVLLVALVGRPERVRAFQQAGATLWVVGFLCFILFPVEGPRPRFPPLDESLHGPLYRLTHWLLGGGAAGAAAFPSIHAGLGALVWLLAWRWERRLAWALVPFTAALLLGTVYGRFHYGVDTLAGVLLAWGSAGCARRVA